MVVESAIDPVSQGTSHPRVDRAVADLAGRQHGVVARTQLLTIGMRSGAIDDRVQRSVLHPLHAGVYALGHRVVTREGAWTAAVLAAGPGAVLSHRSAAALWGIRDTGRSAAEITSPRHCRRPRIDAHRMLLAPDEVTSERGVPVTTVARTLFDLAAVLSPHHLERAITEAEVRRLASPTSLDALIARHRRRRGTAVLRRALDEMRDGGIALTRSELEIAFLAFLDAHGLPRPRTNERIDVAGEPEVDAVWRDARLVAELDSYGIHATRRNFEGDRARDRALTAAGWRVVRITWRHLHRDGTGLATELRTLLGSRMVRLPAPRTAARAGTVARVMIDR